ncbi:hypothetical protein VP01_877g3 [Puccinia sorghi]|uniref:Uncharacterized protein n=1 Tax=Puccinia sorghi TaxID=27349 RepID=A0A0L6U8I0_9BASI|nr:hypothetical protein VP01_877g3 [Puccinia sorghi]
MWAKAIYRHKVGPGIHQLPYVNLEIYNMETYLNVAHINLDDTLTRGRWVILGITHWNFFLSTLEVDLVKLVFPMGTDQLLCEGVS